METKAESEEEALENIELELLCKVGNDLKDLGDFEKINSK